MTPAALSALHAACFQTPRPWSAAEFESLLTSPGVFLVTSSSGFAMGRIVVDEAELLTLAVSPDVRRQGEGRILLAQFETTARARGAATAFLEVSDDNIPAIALYDSFGFALTGRRPGYYRTPAGRRTDALIYHKLLP